VLFFTDDEVLAQIYGGDPAEAIESIAELVWHKLDRPDLNGYFHSFEREGRRWKREGGTDHPPFLHLLAVCVLAATRMGSGDVSPNNYYAHFRDLVGLEGASTPTGFGQSLDYLWDVYTWWLDEQMGGHLGRSTVVVNARLSHIGRPISQTLFRRSDVRQLDQFFRWIGLEADEEEMAEDLLVMYFRAWAPAGDLSPGAARLLQEEQYWPTLGRIIGAYARHWDGTRFDRESSRTAELRVVVDLRMPGSVMVQAIQPDGYPDRLAGQLGNRSVSGAAKDGIFVVEGPLDPRHLLGGGALGEAAARLTLTGSDMFILRMDTEFGGWASVSAFTPGERHFILAAPTVAHEVEQQLERLGKPDVTAGPAPGAFAAWRLIRNLVLEGNERLEGVLAERRPTLRHRFALRGGLPLDTANSYLSGGAPDVWLPPDQAGLFWLEIDGERVDTLDTTVRIAKYLKPRETAAHEISYDVIKRHISMIESMLLIPPTHSEPGQLLEIGEDGEPASHRMVAQTEDAADTAVTIVGPHVRGGTDRWSEPPILLRRHLVEQAWLLGANPGQVKETTKPVESQWMTDLGLSCQLYEARAPFPVQYSVERSKGTYKARERGDLPPSDAAAEDGDVPTWIWLVLWAALAAGDPERWAEYRSLAKKLKAEDAA
jgi:hypothetical protein